MSKHTPGTWSDYYAKLAPVGSVAVWSDQGGMVRRVALCGTHEGIDLDEAEANARLIAAAPDLLKRLKSMVEVAERTWGDWDNPTAVTSSRTVGELNAARDLLAAIAKAEGGDA